MKAYGDSCGLTQQEHIILEHLSLGLSDTMPHTYQPHGMQLTLNNQVPWRVKLFDARVQADKNWPTLNRKAVPIPPDAAEGLRGRIVAHIGEVEAEAEDFSTLQGELAHKRQLYEQDKANADNEMGVDYVRHCCRMDRTRRRL